MSDKKPSDESVAAVEKWAERRDINDLISMDNIVTEHGWEQWRVKLASLLDAQRDAVLDEVTRAAIYELGWSPHARRALTLTIERLRR